MIQTVAKLSSLLYPPLNFGKTRITTHNTTDMHARESFRGAQSHQKVCQRSLAVSFPSPILPVTILSRMAFVSLIPVKTVLVPDQNAANRIRARFVESPMLVSEEYTRARDARQVRLGDADQASSSPRARQLSQPATASKRQPGCHRHRSQGETIASRRSLLSLRAG